MKNEIFKTEDGSYSLKSEKFGVSYHSKYGAIQETQHVFINAALKPVMDKKSELNLLDIGFGTGLNAFMSLLQARKQNKKVNYTGMEAFPISIETAMKLDYTEALEVPELKDAFLKMHSNSSDETIELDPLFSFEKRIQDFKELTDKEQYDVIFFDAFAPNAQPELWEVDLLSLMYNALKPGGIMTTYCAKGQVKRNLKAIGFEIEAIPGPPGKREMTRAIKPIE